MPPEPLALGVDLGSSGLRLALVDRQGAQVVELACSYPRPFSPDNHDAMRPEQVFMARFRRDGVIVPLNQQDAPE